MAKTASQLIFDQNKSTILNAIRDKGTISRIDLAHQTGISPPTVTRIVNSLLKEKLVRNIGKGSSSGGRPPVILEFAADSCYVIGIDWGLTHIKGILADLNGDVVYERDIPYGLSESIEEDLERVCDLVRYLLGGSMISPESLKGIGLAAAGYINKRSGTIEFSPVQKWQNINIKTPLQDAFHVPVFLDYISRVMALSEHLYGNARDVKDLLFVSVDYGLGAGLLMDGNLVQGYDGFSGEIGHTYVTPPPGYVDRTCVCGKKNCLAEFVSGRGIAKTARRRIDAHKKSLLWELCGKDPEKINAKLVGQAAEEGDSFCQQVLKDAAGILGISIANITNILNPESVVLGGKICRSDVFFSEVEEQFRLHGLRMVSRSVSLIRSGMIGQAGVKGAAALVLRGILNFENPELQSS